MRSQIIDCHVHVSKTGDWYGREGIASFDTYHRCMQKAVIDSALLIPVSDQDFDYCLDLRKEYPARFKVAQTLDVADTGAVRWEEVDALKLAPRRMGIPPLSDEIVTLVAEAGRRSVPVVFCCYTQSDVVPLAELHPYAFDRLAKKCPETTMVLAHSCWPHLQAALCVARSNQNVYLDISYFAERAKNTSLLADFCVMAETADRKLLFGTDFPEVDVSAYLQMFETLFTELPSEKRERIFAGNAREVFGFEQQG